MTSTPRMDFSLSIIAIALLGGVAPSCASPSSPSAEVPSTDDLPPTAPQPSAPEGAGGADEKKAEAPKAEPKFAHPQLAACDGGDMAACTVVGTALVEGDGVPKLVDVGTTYLRKSCEGKEASGCFNLAVTLLNQEQKKGALPYFEKACDIGHGKACLQAGFMYTSGEGAGTDAKKGLGLFEKACDLGNTKSCKNAGILHAQGKAVPKDRKRARGYFSKACKGGDSESCELEKELSAPTAPAAPTVANANLTAGEISADGFTLRDLSCKVDGLGFLGSVLIVGDLAKRKSQFNRCAPKGAKPSVRWSFANNRVSNVTVTGASAAVNACVKRTMKGAKTPGRGECVATIPIGKP